MEEFQLWFTTGVLHILSWEGYDHLLFIVLLVLAGKTWSWKRTVLLISAFTLGHAVSLALAFSLHWGDRRYTEFLIALTILITALVRINETWKQREPASALMFPMVTMFGIIHGLSFSFALESLLGTSSGLILPLLYFNTGIEAGQLIVAALVGIIYLLLSGFKTFFHYFKISILCLTGIVALTLCIQRFPF